MALPKLFHGAVRLRLAVAAIAGLGSASPGRGVVLFDDISVYQANTAGAAVTYTTSTPNTFMGDGYVLSTGATDITGMDLFPVNRSLTNYTELEVSIYIWGSVNVGTVNASSPAFGNLLGSYSLTVSGAYSAGYYYPIQGSPVGTSPGVLFNTPLQLNGISTIGVTISYEGTTNGSTFQTANGLTSLISYGVVAGTGSEVFNGYYRNAAGETNGNFVSPLKNLGYADQGIALRIFGDTAATADQWMSSSGGNWGVAANWSGLIAPTSATDAQFSISSSSGYTVVISSADVCKDLYVQTGIPTIDFSAASSSLAISGALSVGQPSSIGGGNASLMLTHSFGGTPVNVSAGSVSSGGQGGMGSLSIGNGVQLVSTGTLSIATGSTVVIAPGGKLIAPAISIAGMTNAWTGLLDIGTSAIDLPSGVLATVTNQVAEGFNLTGGGNWNGTGGITSSNAASDSAHLTAVGAIANNDGSGNPLYGTGGTLGTFGGSEPGLNDVLVRYTYFGDANLDGQVDGSDYSRIDDGYMNHLTGWYNGDFNYDGVVDGSDYTLIDNAFNRQAARLMAVASVQIIDDYSGTQSASVPEPIDMACPIVLTLILSNFTRTSRRRAHCRVD